MGAPKGRTKKRPTKSPATKILPPKSRRKKTPVPVGLDPPPPPPPPTDCAVCSVCEGSLVKNGFVVCVDGNPILANDYPTTGGPWMPAFLPNGTLTWVNGG